MEDRALLAREVAKKKGKKKPSTFSSTDGSQEHKGNLEAPSPLFTDILVPKKKKMDKLLISETNTVESQESEGKLIHT